MGMARRVDDRSGLRQGNGMKEDLSRRADERLEAALAESGARDPREFYRERLRELKRADTVAYEGAVA